MPRRRSTSSSTGRPWVSQPRLARHAVAAHRLVAREEVLEDARDDVVRAGAAVGRRRALVEDEQRRVFATLEALLEDALLLPEGEDARVERGQVDARRDVAEPGMSVAHVTRFRRRAAGKQILADCCRLGRMMSGVVAGSGACPPPGRSVASSPSSTTTAPPRPTSASRSCCSDLVGDAWRPFEDEVRRGEIGHAECLRRQIGADRAPRAEFIGALADTRRAGARPGRVPRRPRAAAAAAPPS